MNQVSRLATTVLVSGGFGLAGLGLGAGIAHANEGPYRWCPGDDPGGYQGLFNSPADAKPNWDWGRFVFISVTTVPAAGFAVVAATVGDWDVAAESAAQLALNLAGIVLAGVLVLRAYQHARTR